MRSKAAKTFYFHADAHALGGFLETPSQQHIPLQSSLSLPSVGGHALVRTPAFNFEEIVSCRSAYTRVSGLQTGADGSSTTLITSVVEGLNILEVFTAERLVAQITVEHLTDGSFPRISFTGSTFEGFKVGGCDAQLSLNPTLAACGGAGFSGKLITYPLIRETGREQAAKLVEGIEHDESGESYRWLIERYGWMASAREIAADGFVLSSLVDSVDPAIPGRSFGHVIEVADFGTVFLGEVIAFPGSVQLTMVRAELGCAAKGRVSGPSAKVNGTMVPP